uniref:ATP synthase complex subunit 8 n=1 Tax=Salmacis bicolor rarispina TaxID=1932358 RepID=A0A1L6Z740_9ECHN|nr:ATP synthase F0 subunit 8 [Salmacis bicolor rarispina]
MPQLDFVWWVINFIIIWVSLFSVLAILLNSKESTSLSQTSSVKIDKNSTNWQWL